MIFGSKTSERSPWAHRLSIALLFVAFTFPPMPFSRAGSPAEALREAFAKALGRWDSLHGYRCTYTLHSSPIDKGQEGFTARYLFAKPSFVRMEIFRGKGEGTILLWEGGDTVRVRKGGVLSVVPLNLNLQNSLLVDPFGQDLRRSTWKYLLEEGRRGLQEGRLQLAGQETLGGRSVHIFSNQYRGDHEPFARDLVYVDRENRWPLKVVRFDKAGRVLQETTFQDVEIDPKVAPSVFREF